jgi:IS5 family transposase
MLIVGYCYGIRFERRLREEVELHIAYRWFCRLDLDDKVPDHSTFSVNRHGRFREFERDRYASSWLTRRALTVRGHHSKISYVPSESERIDLK